MPRDARLVISILAVWRCGMAFVPLEGSHPAHRKAFIVADSGMSVVLTVSGYVLDFAVPAQLAIDAADDHESPRSPVATVPPVPMTSALAYVIYTSGSTGQPKGVAVSHSALAVTLASLARAVQLTHHDTLLSVTTITFDIAIAELFMPLAVGGCLAIASADVAADPRQLQAALTALRATAMQATPAHWQMLVDSSLRITRNFKILCGGEALKPQLARELTTLSERVYNLYGPTETTIWTSCHPLAPTGEVLLGVPLIHARLHLLLADGRELLGEGEGELCVSGPGLAEGYWRRGAIDPELTSRSFIHRSWATASGASAVRTYRTGDLVRRSADGGLSYVGRLDFQVKVHGFRIELGEVEHALAEHPAVAEAVVVVADFAKRSRALVCFLRLRGAAALDAQVEASIRAFVSSRLPPYEVPRLFRQLQSFPTTLNNKTDRLAIQALAESMPLVPPSAQQPSMPPLADQPSTGRAASYGGATSATSAESSSAASFAPPPSVAASSAPTAPVTAACTTADPSAAAMHTPTERALCAVLSEVLGEEPLDTKIDRGSGFIALGVDSIAAQVFVARAVARGLPMTLADLLRCPTLEELAAWVDRTAMPPPSTTESVERQEGVDLPASHLADVGTASPTTDTPAHGDGLGVGDGDGDAEHVCLFPSTAVQQAYWLGRQPENELGNVSTHEYYELRLPDQLPEHVLVEGLRKMVRRQHTQYSRIAALGAFHGAPS